MSESKILQKINATIQEITPVDNTLKAQAEKHLDSLSKPLGSLGHLEEIAARIFAIQSGPRQDGRLSIESDPARIYTVAADHGVVAEGVASTPVEVTRLMVRNFLSGGAGINVLCNTAGVDQVVVDAGCLGSAFKAHPRLIQARISNGSKNLAQEPAMSRLECLKALELGISLADQAAKDGCKAVGTGEMGIGNTTPSTALFSAYTGLEPEIFLGPGAGLDSDGMTRKLTAIKKALALHAQCIEKGDTIDILAALGGLEIAALSGLCLGAAKHKLVLVIDGFISSAAFMAAFKLCPLVAEYAFFSHLSAEPGHKIFMDSIRQKPLLDLGLRLGEGTGAALSFFILRSACNIFNDMATLESLGIQV